MLFHCCAKQSPEASLVFGCLLSQESVLKVRIFKILSGDFMVGKYSKSMLMKSNTGLK